MASTPTKLMTVSEMDALPDPKTGHWELHHGELIEVPFPIVEHYAVQIQLQKMLINLAGDAGIVGMELGFCALPAHEYRRADVAYLSMDRFKSADRKSYFEGAPDLVVEVLSPSNTAAEMRDKKKLCLENGSHEFWVVDIKLREVEVSTPDGHTVTYKTGQSIPIFFAPHAVFAVDDIFGLAV